MNWRSLKFSVIFERIKMEIYKGCVNDGIGIAQTKKGGTTYFFDLSRHEDDKQLEIGDKLELEEWYLSIQTKDLKEVMKLIK